MTKDEFDKYMKSDEEKQVEYCENVLKQETPIFLEEFARLYRKYGELRCVVPGDQMLIGYGGKECAMKEFFLRGLMTVEDYKNE